MKELTFLLSFYILALSFVTCSEFVFSELPKRGSTEISACVKEGNHSHSKESDFCSPFGSCHCCQLTVDIFNLPIFNFITPLKLVEEISNLQQSISKGVLQSIYQPPIV